MNPAEPHPAAQLAAAISAFDPSCFGKTGTEQAKADLIVAVAASLAGANSDVSKALLLTVAGNSAGGAATVFGTMVKTGHLDAAFLNAAAAATGESNPDRRIDGALAAVLFAAAEDGNLSGAAVISAYLVGREIAARFASRPDVDAGQILSLSCAGATARLRGLSADTLAHALTFAAATGGRGLDAFGSGAAARQGMLATVLAEQIAAGAPIPVTKDALAVLAGSGSQDWNAAPQLEPTPAGEDLWDAFEEKARLSLPRDQIAPLFERLETLDKLSDLSAATRLLQISPANKPAPQKVVFAARGTHEPEETTWVP